jgi:hypothetical protein
MRWNTIGRPSPALVVACLALAVALGGTSYAAVLAIPSNSVGTAQLKRAAVTTPKLADRAVTGRKLSSGAVTSATVKDGSLLSADFKPGQLPTGAQGPAGQPGISGLQRVDVTTSASSANSKSLLVNCPSPKKAIGGGARVLGNGASKTSVIANFPDSSGTQWDATASEVVATALTWQLQAYAICANVAS